MADNETIADIRKDAEAKFRELVEAYMQRRTTFQTTLGAMQAFNTMFDRIEAAHERELSKLRPKNGGKFGQFGNAAKLREAMEEVEQNIHDEAEWANDMTSFKAISLSVIYAALAAPARNCDVGTAEDQDERFMYFCARHRQDKGPGAHCMKCPLNDRKGRFCQFAWAQMPYEEGDNNANG